MGMISASGFGNARRPMGAPVKSGATGGSSVSPSAINVGDLRFSTTDLGAGWLVASGQSVAIASYPALGAVLGPTIRGRSYTSTYQLPYATTPAGNAGNTAQRWFYGLVNGLVFLTGPNIDQTGNGRDCMVSSDYGKTFTAVSINAGQQQITNIVFVNNQYVALTLYNGYYISGNGLGWGRQDTYFYQSNYYLFGMAYGNGTYAVYCYNQDSYPLVFTTTSLSANNWTAHNVPISNKGNQSNLVFFNNLFIMTNNVDGINYIITSPDCATWTNRSVGTQYSIQQNTYGGSLRVSANGTLVVFMNANGQYFFSRDGISYSATPPSNDNLVLGGPQTCLISGSNLQGTGKIITNLSNVIGTPNNYGVGDGYINPSDGLPYYFTGYSYTNASNGNVTARGISSPDLSTMMLPAYASFTTSTGLSQVYLKAA